MQDTNLPHADEDLDTWHIKVLVPHLASSNAHFHHVEFQHPRYHALRWNGPRVLILWYFTIQ